jgi:hypothetical protein
MARAQSDGNGVSILFNASIAEDSNMQVKLNGKFVDIKQVNASSIFVTPIVDALAEGVNTFEISGVKFPTLFRDYNFTFKFSQEKSDI